METTARLSYITSSRFLNTLSTSAGSEHQHPTSTSAGLILIDTSK